MTHYVAIDIGGTNIKYGLINQEGQLVESHECQLRQKGGPHKDKKDIVSSYLKKKGPVAVLPFLLQPRVVDPDKGGAGPQFPTMQETPVQEGN